MSNTVRVELEPAYILHTRSYRETSQIIEVFTPGFGRTGLVAKGARRPKSPFRGILNPFQPLRVSWSGRGELATLRQAETVSAVGVMPDSSVMAGFYVNELLLKLLHRHDPHPDLFAHYSSLIGKLAEGEQQDAASVEKALRKFELELLQEIGYALNLKRDALQHKPLCAEQLYEFRIDQGAVPVDAGGMDGLYFTGAELLLIGRLQLDDKDALRKAKRLLRYVLDYYIGDKGLQTRRIAAAMKR
jgi:DNA repair protein RecO (recombination protein O)